MILRQVLCLMCALTLVGLGVALSDGAAAGSATSSVRCQLRKDPSPLLQQAKFVFRVVVDPRGSVRVLAGEGGSQLAYIDASRGGFPAACQSTKSAVRSAGGLAGPWPRSVKSEVYCGSRRTSTLTISVSQVRNSRRQVIGRRVRVAFGRAAALVEATMTRPRGGGISLDSTACIRPG